ncbi:MAG: hypothetical protein FWD52_04625 [Candidatus Bathyarchaeota archaeon]|nr:hypothetical protein [Candidatus Termiticorpusculum sp.]
MTENTANTTEYKKAALYHLNTQQETTIKNITLKGLYPNLHEKQTINIDFEGKSETYEILKKEEHSNEQRGNYTHLTIEKIPQEKT